ncbi:LPP60 lysophospholipase, partial [Atractosteus spatula]|nr:LPP60 lysophospholipase [Atractosteus spatula]
MPSLLSLVSKFLKQQKAKAIRSRERRVVCVNCSLLVLSNLSPCLYSALTPEGLHLLSHYVSFPSRESHHDAEEKHTVTTCDIHPAATTANRREKDAEMAKVFVYYTGGTVGMVPGPDGEHPAKKGDFTKELRRHPELFNKKDGHWFLLPPFATDDCPAKLQISYKVEEEDNPIDSSKMTPKLWVYFANKIKENAEEYDGFVLLHGTDTLAYTSSALSFLLWGLKKPVVVTGAQRSLFEPRSDAVENILGALLIAGGYCRDPALQLVRGTVSLLHTLLFISLPSQTSTGTFCPLELHLSLLLGTIIDSQHTPPPNSNNWLPICDWESLPDVRILRLFPGITENYVKSVLAGDGGVILETYGSGNAPDDDWFIDALKAATDRGVLILNCTQVYKGSVRPIYETGTGLEKAGVLSGFDITPEAALTKMLWCLHVTQDKTERKEVRTPLWCGAQPCRHSTKPSLKAVRI